MSNTTTTSRPSATKLVRRVLKELPDGTPNYEHVSQSVLDLIPEDEYRSYLLEFIKLNVATQIADQRNGVLSRLRSLKPPKPGPREPEPSTFIDIDAPPPPLVRRGPSKRDLIVSAAQKALQSRVFVPGVGHQFIGDLTVEYARAVAEDRTRRAGEMSDSASMYESFANLMDAEGVSTLSEIPEKFAAVVNPALI